MAEATKIEWATHTMNFWIGCTKISNGKQPSACDNCYAADMSHRYGWAEFEAGAPRHRTSTNNWKQPKKWNRKAKALGIRESVFALSLGDFFDSEVEVKWRDDAINVIEDCDQLDWLVLTKRPQVARKVFEHRKPPPNMTLGVTVETQPMADLRIPQLLAIPGLARCFLSCEPLMGPMDLRRYLAGIDWVIAGGESGPKARPSNPQWFRDLRDQCDAAGKPFFFKQWGEFAPEELGRNGVDTFSVITSDGEHLTGERAIWGQPGAAVVARVGKKRAGALLDGNEHRAFPR
jgi:protein gp37